MHWYDHAIMYHIYPLGFCGAPKYNEGGEPVNRLEKVLDWIPHLKEMQVDAVYFGPVFESAEHGYDTSDYRQHRIYPVFEGGYRKALSKNAESIDI